MRIVCGAALGVALLVGLTVVGFQLTGEEPTAAPSVPAASDSSTGAALALPGDGAYRIQVASPGQCLSEIAGRADGNLYPRPCAQAFPPMSLDRIAGDEYRIRARHPQYGPGCLAVDDQGGQPIGAPVTNSTCGERSTEVMRLEPVETPARGFRIRPVHSDLCLGLDGSTGPLRQRSCDPAATGQVFTFQPG